MRRRGKERTEKRGMTKIEERERRGGRERRGENSKRENDQITIYQ